MFHACLTCFYITLQYLSVRWKGIVRLGSCILHTVQVNNEVRICNTKVMFMSCIFFSVLVHLFQSFPCCLQHTIVNNTGIQWKGKHIKIYCNSLQEALYWQAVVLKNLEYNLAKFMKRFFTRHTSNWHTPWYRNQYINFLSPEQGKEGLARMLSLHIH